MERRRAVERKFQRRVFGSIAVLTLWAILFSATLLSVANDMYAFIKPSDPISVTVSEPMKTRDLSRLLSHHGVINNPTVFSLYLRAKQRTEQAEAFVGTLELNSDMSYREILAELKKANQNE